MKPRPWGAWIGLLLSCGAVAAAVWVKFQASEQARNLIAYFLVVFAVSATTYLCFASVRGRMQHASAPDDVVVVTRAKAPVWLHIGAACMGLAFATNAVLIGILAGDSGKFLQNLDKLLNESSNLQTWFDIALGLFAFGFGLSWLGAYQLRLTQSRIEFWSLFGGYRSLPLDQIHAAQKKTGWDPIQPLHRLLIIPKRRHDRPIVVNLKVFPTAEIERAILWLGAKLEPTAGGRLVSPPNV